ncbi:hypothetical protein B0H34DRAFT_522724 [Crassisporium funariophilum]|nr:hypothetical protein B0H34DRAFT_522724 [Crassisporium funariophilum]
MFDTRWTKGIIDDAELAELTSRRGWNFAIGLCRWRTLLDAHTLTLAQGHFEAAPIWSKACRTVTSLNGFVSTLDDLLSIENALVLLIDNECKQCYQLLSGKQRRTDAGRTSKFHWLNYLSLFSSRIRKSASVQEQGPVSIPRNKHCQDNEG